MNLRSNIYLKESAELKTTFCCKIIHHFPYHILSLLRKTAWSMIRNWSSNIWYRGNPVVQESFPISICFDFLDKIQCYVNNVENKLGFLEYMSVPLVWRRGSWKVFVQKTWSEREYIKLEHIRAMKDKGPCKTIWKAGFYCARPQRLYGKTFSTQFIGFKE